MHFDWAIARQESIKEIESIGREIERMDRELRDVDQQIRRLDENKPITLSTIATITSQVTKRI